MPVLMASNDQKVMLHLIWIAFMEGMQWYYFGCNWHHVMSRLLSVASHDEKSHVGPNFEYLELTNVAVPLTMPPASHDANASTICIT